MRKPAGSRSDARPRSLAGIHIDPEGQTPLYLQVRMGLDQAIRGGVFKPEEALPSERVLAVQLGVSRVTARKALDALTRDGVVVRRHGSGNYIAPLLNSRSLAFPASPRSSRSVAFTRARAGYAAW